MSRRGVPLPSLAMAVALYALFVALGGASYALSIPRNRSATRPLVRRPLPATPEQGRLAGPAGA